MSICPQVNIEDNIKIFSGKAIPIIWTLPALMICLSSGVEGFNLIVETLLLLMAPTLPVLVNSRSVPVSSALEQRSNDLSDAVSAEWDALPAGPRHDLW